MSPQEMRELGDIIKSKLNDGVIFLVSRDEDKIVFISMATEKAVELGVNVGVLVKHASNVVGGNGGGRKDLAQGGGKFADKLDDALKEIEILLREQLKI
jgi:alanyl-tRNA synthetase